MKKGYFVSAILVWLSCFSLLGGNILAMEPSSPVMLSQSSSEGPTICGTHSEGEVICWDGAYTGQTEEVWENQAWVNDTDGVDCVIFRYRWRSQTEWINRTTTLTDGNETRGWYSGNFTYDVWWNEDTGYPGTEGDGGNFFFKIFANDTLGNWNETLSMEYQGGYIVVFSPEGTNPTTEIENLQLVFTLAGSAIVSLVVIVLVLKKYR